MPSTPNATANATLQLIVAALTADKRRVHGQVKLAGKALGIDGVCGFPIMIGREGWRLWDIECLGNFWERRRGQECGRDRLFPQSSLAGPRIKPRLGACRGGGLKMRFRHQRICRFTFKSGPILPGSDRRGYATSRPPSSQAGPAVIRKSRFVKRTSHAARIRA